MRRYLSLICLSLLLTLTGSTHAQTTTDDWLVVANYGDLWVSDEANYGLPRQFPTCGFANNFEAMASPLLMAPNGDHLAYLTASLDQDNAANTLRLCDGIDFTEYVVSGQPTSVNAADTVSTYRVHSRPAWSPNSNRLAWTMIDYSSSTSTLSFVIYDVAAHQITLQTNTIPTQLAITAPPPIVWANVGLLVMHTPADTAVPEILGLNAQGEQLGRLPVPITAEKGQPTDMLFADLEGTDALVIIYDTGAVDVLADGLWSPLAGTLQLFGTETPSGSFTLNYHPVNADTATWEVALPDASTIPLPYTRLHADHAIAIAPSGSAIAYARDQVVVWTPDRQITVGIPSIGTIDPQASLVWSPLAWRIVSLQ